VDVIAIFLEIPQQPDLSFSGQRGLESEIPAISAKGMNLLQNDPPGPDRGPF
jgi:hypothetical protein